MKIESNLRFLSFDKNNQLVDIAEPYLARHNSTFFRRAWRDSQVAWVRVQAINSNSLSDGRNVYKQKV